MKHESGELNRNNLDHRLSVRDPQSDERQFRVNFHALKHYSIRAVTFA